MERSLKTWGEKWNIFHNDLCEVSILYLRPHRRCSWHSHQQKYNQFFVIEGVLVIKTIDGTARLEQGQIFTIKPGEMHEFQTTDVDSLVQEIMFVKYDPDDIDRENVGGPIDAIISDPLKMFDTDRTVSCRDEV